MSRPCECTPVRGGSLFCARHASEKTDLEVDRCARDTFYREMRDTHANRFVRRDATDGTTVVSLGTPLTWAVGVTTAPRREPTLQRSLESLADAGWPSPLVFAEPQTDVPAGTWRVVQRPTKYGAWSNWLAALRELAALKPAPAAILLAQDDTLFCRDIRHFLEQVVWPADAGVLSLYCPRPYIGQRGWNRIDAPEGLVGALAYVFPLEAARQLLCDPRVLGHNMEKGIDAVVGRWAAEAKRPAYYLSPSLAQHLGDTSTIYAHAPNRGNRMSHNFVGAQFNAPTLLPPQQARPATYPEFISTERLATDAREFAGRLPENISGIAGVPRSGMLPASILATLLHLPLFALDRRTGLQPVGNGGRLENAEVRSGPLLVIEDSIHTGTALRKARESLRQFAPGQSALFAAMYPRPGTEGEVDLYCRLAPVPHLFEWNFLNCNQTREFALDFDGVLCHDYPGRDNDDEFYHAFLSSARPLWLPRRSPIPLIVTARLEKYRAETEAWLRKHRVEWKKLVMGPWPTAAARRRDYNAGVHKGRPYAASNCRLFVESDPRQAEAIFQESRKPVLCPATGQIFQ